MPKNTNVKVHKGFNLYYTDYGQYLIQKENQDIFEEADNIVITGHSLGGAVATIAFMDLNAQYKDNKDSKLKVSYYTTVFLTLFLASLSRLASLELETLSLQVCFATKIYLWRDMLLTWILFQSIHQPGI